MNLFQTLPVWFIGVWAGVIGAAVGSLLNVVICRLPKAESLFRPRSHCTVCGTPIKPWNNIPILSYLLLRGRCPDCGAPFSIRYLVVEALGAAVAVLPVLAYGISWYTLGGIVLGWYLIALAFIDLETRTLPDHLVLPMGVTGLLVSFAGGGWHGLLISLLAAAIGGGFQLLIYFLSKVVMRREGVGDGDVTMTAGFCTYLHPLLVAFALASAAAVGLAASILIVVVRKLKSRKGGEPAGEYQVPFGFYLAIGAWISYMYGGGLWSYYLDWVIGGM